MIWKRERGKNEKSIKSFSVFSICCLRVSPDIYADDLFRVDTRAYFFAVAIKRQSPEIPNTLSIEQESFTTCRVESSHEFAHHIRWFIQVEFIHRGLDVFGSFY